MTDPLKKAPAEPGLSDADVVTAYCALSKQASEEYRARRDLEWKMHLSLWTILSAIIYVCTTHDLHLGLWMIPMFLAVPMHLIWIIKIHRGQIHEDDLSKVYRWHAEQLLPKLVRVKDDELASTRKGESVMPRSWEQSFRSYLWWVFIELGTTILIITVGIKLIW